MKKIMKILIVDDSVLYRSQIRAAIETLPNTEIVGTAPHGKIALEKMKTSAIDLVILDLEMPEMDGLTTLRQMKIQNIKTQAIVFSSVSQKGAEITMEALNAGALDFLPKPSSQDAAQDKNPVERLQRILIQKLQQIQETLFPPIDIEISAPTQTIPAPSSATPIQKSIAGFRPQVLVIASSTGGPTALEMLFENLKGPFSFPILIAQHMPPVFTTSFASRLQRMSGIPTREGVHGELLKPNQVYIAPGNFHMFVRGSKEAPSILLDQSPQVNFVRPSADCLFESAAKIYGPSCLGFVLTGMGSDGLNGSRAVKEAGGKIVIQNKETCIVFGMPGAVFSAGTYDQVLPLTEIRTALMQLKL